MIFWYLLLLILVGFAIVVFVGAPYVPIFRVDIESLFDKAKLKRGDRLVELGCGDGRVLIAAAKRGIKADGYELNPILALIAYLRTIRYRQLVRVYWGDFWKVDLSQYDIAFTFLITRFMPKLERWLGRQKHPIVLISYVFTLPHKKPAARTRNGYIYRFDGSVSAR